MIIKAEQKYVRQTSTRLRLVARAVSKLSPSEALDQLEFMNKKAARTLREVMKQAVANAVNNLGLSLQALTIKEIIIGEGPQYKRFRAVSRGRAHTILKRTAHVKVLLESKEEAKKVHKPVKKEVIKKATAEEVVQPEKLQAPTFKSVGKVTAKTKQSVVRPVAVRKTGER